MSQQAKMTDGLPTGWEARIDLSFQLIPTAVIKAPNGYVMAGSSVSLNPGSDSSPPSEMPG